MTLTEGSKKLAEALLLPINPAAVVLLGIYTTLWGFWVANPWWTVFTQAELFSQLAQTSIWFIPPEVLWGSIAILCGCITIYGALKRSYGALVRGASVAGWHWFMISVFYFIGDPLNTGGISALIFAVYAAFVYLNIRVNFKDRRNSSDLLNTR